MLKGVLNMLKLFSTISFAISGITFVIGLILLLSIGGTYRVETDYIEAIPMWILSMGFMVSGIGWLILSELRSKAE